VQVADGGDPADDEPGGAADELGGGTADRGDAEGLGDQVGVDAVPAGGEDEDGVGVGAAGRTGVRGGHEDERVGDLRDPDSQ